MCGFAGFIDFRKETSQEVLRAMTDAVTHRGPDSSGVELIQQDGFQLGLGHRRLSIIDLSESGSQPMSFDTLKIIFNGEVYNYKEVQKELEVEGYSFVSTSDTEVVLKAYHKWGAKAVDRFIGMFACVIYDTQKEEVFFLRDRAGVKPFYYYQKNGTILFGSELKSFHSHPRFEKKLNYDALGWYFKGGYIPVPDTIYQNCYKLPQGHWGKVNLKTQDIHIEKYWDVVDHFNKGTISISDAELLEETESLLKSAFNYRMVADVPVGMFLSGGYDSTAVTALLQSDRTEKIKTFTIGFEEEGFNEAPEAKKIAEHIGTEHHEYYCTAKDALEILPKLPEIYDEPFGDSSAIPTTLVSQFAKQHVKVSLSADGGDELMGGYGKYFGYNNNNYKLLGLPKALRKTAGALSRPVLDAINNPNYQGKIEALQALLDSDGEGQFKIEPRIFGRKSIDHLLTGSYILKNSYFDDFKKLGKNVDSFNSMLAVDYKTYMIDDILTKVDRATMSVSLEGREPLLDHRIAEFLARVPSQQKLMGGKPKGLLRKIVHQYVPQELLDRPKKGFGVPLVHWFHKELKDYFNEYLNSTRIKEAGLFQPKYVEGLLNQYFEQGKQNTPSAYSELVFTRLWYLLCFEMWREKWGHD